MQKLLIATTNPAKFAEISQYLSAIPVKFVSLSDVGIIDEIVEDGETFEENSQKKALFYSALSGLPAVSDDGGLMIDALGGEPGVNTKYWAGPEGRDEDLIVKMMQVSKELPDDNRKAQFIAVLSFATPSGAVWSEEASIDLIVAKEPLTKHIKGFPFRSFLLIPELDKYYHEQTLTREELEKYNHRYKALMKLIKIIQKEMFGEK